jgi:hypothetical protein
MNLQHGAADGIPGGEGGSVPDSKQVGVGARCSAPTGEQESSKPAHQSTSSTGAIEAAMVAAGVFLMSSRARWAIAEQLHGHGIHSDDIPRLHRWIASGEPKEGPQRRYLAGLLSNPDDVAEALKTLDRHAETRGNQDRNGMQYEPQPMEGEDPEQFSVERDAQIVFGRIHGDHASAETVAAEMGWKLEQVQSLYTMGAQLYGGDQ